MKKGFLNNTRIGRKIAAMRIGKPVGIAAIVAAVAGVGFCWFSLIANWR